MLQTVSETPFAVRCPAGMQDQIMHSMLTGRDFTLMGTDMTPGEFMFFSIQTQSFV
jgi:PhnB protein